MTNIRIRTEHGHMVIYADQFFPCSLKKFSQLLKIIKQFSYLNNVHEIAEQMNQYFTEQIQENETIKTGYAEMYSYKMREQAEYRDILEAGKHPNGIPLTKEELKHFKKKAADSMQRAKQHFMKTKKIERDILALKKCLGMLEQAG